MAFCEQRTEGITLESDLREERAEWLKTKLEGSEEAKSWKIKCQTVFELLKGKFPSVTQVEAGKIAKKAFSFIKRQNCHQRDGSSISYYYRVQVIVGCSSSTCEVNVQTDPMAETLEADRVPELEEKLLQKDREIVLKNQQIKRLATSHGDTVKKLKCLERQKKTLVAVVNELEESRLERTTVNQKQDNSTASSHGEFADVTGIDYIPEGHMTQHGDGGTVLGSGSYGTCELKNWRNIKVCVKKVHKKANAGDVKQEAAILKQLQLSLYVPVLLGINVISKPFYIVTKFHSAMTESSLTLHRAIKKCTIGKKKWMSILHKCALGIQSVHELRIIHNDLHQNNIVIDRMNGHVHPIIIDFGKACKEENGRCRKVDNIDHYTELHPWIAPETINGEHKESKLSDVYGLGYIMMKVNSIAKVHSIDELISLCRSVRSQRPAIDSIVESLQSTCSLLN